MFDNSFPACVLFVVVVVVVVVVVLMEISSRTLIPLFRPGSVHSGSASLVPGRVACELVS